MSVPIINTSAGSECPCGIKVVINEYEDWRKTGVDYFGNDIWSKVITTLSETQCVDPCTSSSDPCCPKPFECDAGACADSAPEGCVGSCEDYSILCPDGTTADCGKVCKINCPSNSETDSSSDSCYCDCGAGSRDRDVTRDQSALLVFCEGNCGAFPYRMCYYDIIPISTSNSIPLSVSSSNSDCDW